MPEVFRFFGYIFFFYSREHEPLHIHVEGNGGQAKFEFNEEVAHFELRENMNIKAGDLRKIARIIDDNEDIIIRAWNRYFNVND